MTDGAGTANVQCPTSNDLIGGRKSFPRRGKLFSTLWKSWVFLVAGAGAPAWAEAAAEEPAPWVAEADWGPLASWLVDADGSARFRAAGPLWERAAGTNGRSLQAYARPLWARAADPANARTAWDFCWPVAAGKTFGPEKSWRALVAWFLDEDRTAAASAYRFWLLPIWFHGRDDAGTGYAALFPLGGEIRNFLWKDRIRFALWPLWAQSEVNDVRTVNVLWPVYSRTTTPDGHLEKFRVFPFYGHAKNARQYEKRTVLWPVWTHARYTHPKARGTAWVFFPVCGRVDLNTQKGWMALPPLFQFIRGEAASRTYCPWPFYQRETGAREKLYVWPLYGRRADGTLRQRFWLWPLVSWRRDELGRKTLTRWVVAPVYVNASQAEGPPEARRVTANRTKLWPLFSRAYDREAGSCRLRLLDLWPTGHPPPVERSWAPLWTVLDYRATGEASDLDVLWGLYRATRREGGARAFSLFPLWRHERAEGEGRRRWSVLKGLLAYDRTATNRQVRFLWLGRVRLAPAAGKAEEAR